MTRRFADFNRPAPKPYTWIDYFLIGVVTVICTAAMLFIFVVCLLVKPVRAHEAMSGWEYPTACCAGYDCAEIAESRVKEAPGGYVVDGKFHVAHSEVKHSPDGHYHACFPNPETLRCLFIPPSGS